MTSTKNKHIGNNAFLTHKTTIRLNKVRKGHNNRYIF